MTGCSAALLAGGKSSRMGRDKCLIEFDGVPLWKRQSDLLKAIATEVMIVAPTRPEWCPSDLRWVADRVTDCGPLGGLNSALAGASYARVIVLAVDLPEMSEAYLRRLLALSADTRGIVPLLDNLLQPLSAVYPRSAASVTLEHLRDADKSLQRLARQLAARGAMQISPVAEVDRPCFRNFNTATD